MLGCVCVCVSKRFQKQSCTAKEPRLREVRSPRRSIEDYYSSFGSDFGLLHSLTPLSIGSFGYRKKGNRDHGSSSRMTPCKDEAGAAKAGLAEPCGAETGLSITFPLLSLELSLRSRRKVGWQGRPIDSELFAGLLAFAAPSRLFCGTIMVNRGTRAVANDVLPRPLQAQLEGIEIICNMHLKHE